MSKKLELNFVNIDFLDTNFFACISCIILSFNFHTYTFSIYEVLEFRDRTKMLLSTSIGVFMSILIYLLVGIIGYIMYPETDDSFLDSLEFSSFVMFQNICFVICTVMSFPITFTAFIHYVVFLLEILVTFLRDLYSDIKKKKLEIYNNCQIKKAKESIKNRPKQTTVELTASKFKNSAILTCNALDNDNLVVDEIINNEEDNVYNEDINKLNFDNKAEIVDEETNFEKLNYNMVRSNTVVSNIKSKFNPAFNRSYSVVSDNRLNCKFNKSQYKISENNFMNEVSTDHINNFNKKANKSLDNITGNRMNLSGIKDHDNYSAHGKLNKSHLANKHTIHFPHWLDNILIFVLFGLLFYLAYVFKNIKFVKF